VVLCCPPVWVTPFWDILKKVHENPLCVLTDNQPLGLRGSVVFN